MRKYFYILIFLSISFGVLVLAQQPVVFPVEELGGCGNFKECAKFCDRAENFKVCTDFAEAHGMVPPEQADKARRMLEAADMGGPGGCQGHQECEAYCSIPENIEECIVFALEHDLMPPQEREEAEKVLAAIRQGAIPPPCAGPESCDIYCSEPDHLEECLAFGEAAGFMTPEEAEMARRTGGRGPGGCRGPEECEAFCQDPANMEECMAFGLEHGLMPPEEVEQARRVLEAIRKGAKPPPCRGPEECDQYCSQPEHIEECINFSVAAGFMSPEEAEQAKKMAAAGLIGGPGGCRGKEECEAFCDNPDNMIECIEFGLAAGFMTPEEAEQAKKMAELGIVGGPGGCQSDEECKAFCDNPDNMQECMEFGEKMGLISPEEAEGARKMMEGGPGGCQGEQECEAYCSQKENFEECIKFNVEQGFMTPEEAEEMRKMMEMSPPEGMMPPAESQPMPPKEMMPPPEEIKPPPPEEIKLPEEIMPPPKPEEMKMPLPKEILTPLPEEIISFPEEIKLPEEIVPLEETPETLFDLVKFLAEVAAPFLRLK